MGVGAGLYMYVVVVQRLTFAISSPDELLFLFPEQDRSYAAATGTKTIPYIRAFFALQCFYHQVLSVCSCVRLVLARGSKNEQLKKPYSDRIYL